MLAEHASARLVLSWPADHGISAGDDGSTPVGVKLLTSLLVLLGKLTTKSFVDFAEEPAADDPPLPEEMGTAQQAVSSSQQYHH